MTFALFSLILISVSSSSIAQILLKQGMSQPQVTYSIAQGDVGKIFLAIGMNPWVFSGLMLYFLSAIVWLFVLAKMEVSYVYPFVGLGFILTLLLGHFLFGDSLSVTRILGTMLVSIGVIVISK